jgi:hypothetical protein
LTVIAGQNGKNGKADVSFTAFMTSIKDFEIIVIVLLHHLTSSKVYFEKSITLDHTHDQDPNAGVGVVIRVVREHPNHKGQGSFTWSRSELWGLQDREIDCPQRTVYVAHGRGVCALKKKRSRTRCNLFGDVLISPDNCLHILPLK